MTDIIVGQRYGLHLPHYPSKHPLKGLLDQVSKFWHGPHNGVDGKDPINLLGNNTVQVLGDGYVVESQPRPVFWPQILTDEQLAKEEAKQSRLKSDWPGVLVHLARWAHPRTRVEVPTEEIVRLGLNPEYRFFLEGTPQPYDMDAYDDHGCEVIEEKDFIIPVKWLTDLAVSTPWEADSLEREALQALQPKEDRD
jgi:hypothetical protein